MTDHLVRWHQKYGSRGLVVVGIERYAKKSRMAEHLKEKKVTYPAAHDAGSATAKAYGVKATPTAYLIGRDGKVLWEAHPRPKDADELAKRIEAALGPKGPEAKPVR